MGDFEDNIRFGKETDYFSENGKIVTAIASWLAMLVGVLHFFGLLFQKCFKCCSQERSCVRVVNDKFFESLHKQPQEWLRRKCGMKRCRWRTKPVVGWRGNMI